MLFSPKSYSSPCKKLGNFKQKKRFDTREAQDKFFRDLRGSENKYTVTQSRNVYAQIWATDPTRRIDRPVKKLKEISFLKRSGFNKIIDSKD
mgnify:CR=1 FL=1